MIWLDHEPGEPGNKRDRGNLSIFPQVDIAGEIVEPRVLFDRLSWGSASMRTIGETPQSREWVRVTSLAPPHHWKFCELISEGEYRYRFRDMRRQETTRPEHPVLKPRKRADPRNLELPDFSRAQRRAGD